MEMNSRRCGMGLPKVVALTPCLWRFQRKQKWLTVIFWGSCFNNGRINKCLVSWIQLTDLVLYLQTRQSHQVKQHPHIYPCIPLTFGSQKPLQVFWLVTIPTIYLRIISTYWSLLKCWSSPPMARKKNLFVNKWEATKQITDWDIPRSCPTS